MTRFTLVLLIAVCAATTAFAEAAAPGEFVVSASSLNVRLAANASAKVKDKLYRGQEVDVFEVSNGWARISRYYDGASEGLSGDVADWVSAEHLSPVTKTPPPARPRVEIKIDVDSPVYQAIKSSDDLAEHQGIFVQVSEKLVDAGQCKLSDFRDIGGWWRSAAHKPEPVYYTYCGGASNEDRIYVNTATGEVFR
jgi:hypothetical protein